jgi:hypothetical protein
MLHACSAPTAGAIHSRGDVRRGRGAPPSIFPAAAAVLLLALLLSPWPAAGADWGSIEPGVTTLEQVRGRYGAPSKETRAKVEGYDTVQWLYEGSRAPAGIVKMTVDFGLLTPAGYQPSVVRVLTLEPKPAIFGPSTVIQGWGVPDGVKKNPDGTETLFWKNGLFVTFDKERQNALVLIFSPPQPEPAGQGAAPPSPAPGAPAPRR